MRPAKEAGRPVPGVLTWVREETEMKVALSISASMLRVNPKGEEAALIDVLPKA